MVKDIVLCFTVGIATLVALTVGMILEPVFALVDWFKTPA